MTGVRIGLGIDVHRRSGARRLYLGGELFDGEPGLEAHSDGDVVCHALADALLGAAGMGDLGQHFPDSDPAYAGMGGLDLLGRVVDLLAKEGLRPDHCDLTVLADGPPIEPRRDAIRRNLATALGVADERVSVKATRPEGLGLTGDGAGCLAVAAVGPAAAGA
jgi:2-C-methyl-D-erythritol 2,4-cyclodiphosphate synthase